MAKGIIGEQLGSKGQAPPTMDVYELSLLTVHTGMANPARNGGVVPGNQRPHP